MECCNSPHPPKIEFLGFRVFYPPSPPQGGSGRCVGSTQRLHTMQSCVCVPCSSRVRFVCVPCASRVRPVRAPCASHARQVRIPCSCRVRAVRPVCFPCASTHEDAWRRVETHGTHGDPRRYTGPHGDARRCTEMHGDARRHAEARQSPGRWLQFRSWGSAATPPQRGRMHVILKSVPAKIKV